MRLVVERVEVRLVTPLGKWCSYSAAFTAVDCRLLMRCRCSSSTAILNKEVTTFPSNAGQKGDSKGGNEGGSEGGSEGGNEGETVSVLGVAL